LHKKLTRFVCSFQDLENSASSDALVREKIASLPPEVSEIGLLSKLEGNVGSADLMCVA
jgi:regulator of Ty1 transposition protein 103